VPIATQCLHAAGSALAFKVRNEPRVAVTVVGDGGSSKGDFYGAINVAGAMQLPLVAVIVNNQWAISVPRNAQTGAKTLAQKGIAAGLNACRSTATTSSRCARRWISRSSARATATAAWSSKPSPIACPTTPPPTTRAAIVPTTK
jgi:deoxyxylulose-5-phosphate synthase